MVLYFDGPNNTGKTTLIKALAKKLKKDYRVSIFHCDEKFENTFSAYSKLINEHENDILLLDRGWLSEQVYPYLRKRVPKMGIFAISALSCNENVVTFITKSSLSSIKNACKDKNEEFDECETAQELHLFNNLCFYLEHKRALYYTIHTFEYTTNFMVNYILAQITIPDKCKKSYFVKGYAADAGVDILLDKNVTFKPGTTTVVELPIKITPNEGQMAYLVERTSAAKKGLFVHQCPIDANYIGTIHAIVFNSSDKPIIYKTGEAFCQVVNVSINYPNNVPCKKEGKRTDSCFGGTDGQNKN